MKHNLYYSAVRKRHNFIKQTVIGLLSTFSSYPRLLLEVFIRKGFGERYFNWGSAVGAFLVFSLLPDFFYSAYSYLNMRTPHSSDFLKSFGLWYLYLIAFLTMSFIRWKEIRRKPGVFDFARYSLSQGRINPFFFNLPFFKKRPSIRTVEILVEPGLFFLIGLVLLLLGQGAGFMLVLCSISYCFSYWADYKAGDDFIMDIIDKQILNEDMERDFVENEADPYNPRGAYIRMKRPQNRNDRRAIFDAIVIDADDETMAL